MTTIKVTDLFSLEVGQEGEYGYVGLFSKKQNGMYTGYLNTFLLVGVQLDVVIQSLILSFKKDYNRDILDIVKHKSIEKLEEFYQVA